MKILSALLALYWFATFIAFCFGHQPEPFTLGYGLLNSALLFAVVFVDEWKKG